MIEVPFNDLRRHYNRHADAIERSVLDVLRSGWWLNGSNVRKFSEQFSDYLGTTHCIPVANGTDALELAMKAAACTRVGKREVITTANSGGYSSTAAYSAGLIPVYADVTEETQLLSISSAVDCLSSDSLAVVATHLYGGMIDVRALRLALDEAGRSDVLIIEDCAQSHGARLDGRRTGSLGDISAFSFYPTKNLGAAGDAGAVATSSDELAGIVRNLHQYGWASKYSVRRPDGRNSRMDELQATILSALLPHLDEANRERAEIVARYEAVANPLIHFVQRRAGAVVHLAVALTARRDELQAFLTARNIATDVHYPILDCAQDGWQGQNYRIAPGGLPVSMLSSKQVLSLPCFVGMTASEVDHVVLALSEFSHQ